jgi:filamentous hemagglutinin
MAQVRSDSSAPGDQRPTVLKSANGVIQINVTTPSAAGVSKNQMSQMDVDRQGLILNNSRTHTQTQIGGYVQSNPWLANGEARVLLMQVNSPQATSLQGFVEVAGRRSEVVIANPSGIFLNGAGFINTSRATLTTGEVQMQGGGISGYAVRGGTITVGERGFDARATDFTSVLSRALVVRGPLHANELQVVTGNNQINADSQAQGRVSASGAAPSVAIDVSELGGMYAGKITLISTEAGVGVSNAGQIQSGSGGLSLNANGDLVNTGAVASQGNIQFNSSANITQVGQLAAAKTANVVAAGQVTNTGVMSAGQVLKLEGNSLVTSGQLNAGELLHLKSAGAISNSGDIVLQGRVQIEAGADISNTGLIHSQQSVRLTTPGNIINPGDMLAGGQLQWQASQDLNNSGRLEGQTGVNLQGRALNNTGVVVSGAALSAIASADVSNTGLMSSVGDMRIDSDGQLVNAAGAALAAGGHAEWGARSAITNQGWMGAAGNATLRTSDEEGRIVSGRQSVLGAGLTADGVANLQKGHLNVQAGQSGDGSVQLQGLVRGGQKIEAQGGAVDIAGQDWLSQNIEVRATAGDVSAQGTRLVAKNALELSASETLNTNQSHLGADTLGVQAAQWLANASLIEHSGTASDSVSIEVDRAIELQGSWLGSNAQSLSLTSERIDLQAAEVQHTGTGTLGIHSTGASALDLQTALVQSEGEFTLQAQALLADDSTLTAQGSMSIKATDSVAAADTLWAAGEQLTVTAGSVTAPGAQWYGVAQGVAVSAQGAVDLSASQVQSEGDVRIAAQGLNLGSAQVSGDAVELSAGQHTLSTRSAKVVAQADLDLQGQRLDNRSGVLQGLGVLSAQTTQDVNNQDGQMLSGQGLVIQASALNNASGRIQSVGHVVVDVQSGALNNRAGLIASEKSLQIQAGALDNRQTQSTTASAKLGLQAAQMGVQAQTLDNSQGSVLGRETVALTLGQGVNNQAGIVSSQGDLQVQDRHSAPASRQLVIDNTQDGVLAANGQMRLAAKDLDNGGRVVLADTASPSDSVLEVDLSGDWNNQAGAVLQSAQHLSLTVDGNVHNAGTIEAGQTLEVQTQQWRNSAGSVLRSGSLLANVGSLSNQGLINSGELLLGAGSVLNSEGGRVYGDNIVIAASSLRNVGNRNVAPVIASRGDMDLAVGSLSNEEGALLLSLGDTRVGAEIDANGRATGMAGSFTNSSAEVDVMGNMTIQAQSVLNTDAHQHQYSFTTVTDVKEYISMDQGHNFGKIHNATTGNIDWNDNSFGSERIATFKPFDGSGNTRANIWLVDEYVRTITETGSYGTDPARIGVGGHLTIAAGNTTNDKSTVVVGGQLNIQTGGFQNIDGYHTRSQDEVGTSYEAYTVRNLIGVHRRRFGPAEERTFEMQTQYTVSGFDRSKQSLSVASRMIVRSFYKQMRMRSVPVFHGPHRGFALERRLG